jgi:deoxyribose-phosphate aldolase
MSAFASLDNTVRAGYIIDLIIEAIAGSSAIAKGDGSTIDIARHIDHTLLKPEATEEHIRKLCEEAREYGFATVCVNPTYVSLAANLLQGLSTKVCTVVGFPLGAHLSEVKAVEAERAIRDGAKEIDMVINIGALKSGDDELVWRDIAAVVDICHKGAAVCKVIIEAALLTDDEKVRACQAAVRAQADFVKTSTGFGPSGATVHDVALMVQAVQGTSMGVKAAGGIRSLAEAKKMLEAGATRIGTSASVQIMKEYSRQSKS